MIPTKKHPDRYGKKKLRKNLYGSDDEKRLAALLTMEYIVLSVANAYHEEAKELMEQYAVYDFETKRESEAAIKRFDDYHQYMMQQFFHGQREANNQMTAIYEELKKTCDEQILDSIILYKEKVEEGVYER